MLSLLEQSIGVGVLLLLGFLFGRFAEKRHFKFLREWEASTQYLPVVASRHPPEDQRYEQVLVSGNVVIASDYFKTFLAGLIKLFGGRVTPFESLLDRARRESLLRMKHQAIELNAAYVFNVKYDTTRVAGAMEVLAYGTALIPESTDSEQVPHAL